MTGLIDSVGIIKMFYVLAVVYFIMMFAGHLLLKKPDGWVEEQGTGGAKVGDILKNPVFIGIWLMFYINITCGLALISQEKDILTTMGVSAAVISLVSSMSAIFNAGGRIGFSAAADKLKDRNTIYKLSFILSIGSSLITIFTNAVNNGIVILAVILLCIINAGYGGGFSNLPTLLSDRFGMKSISQIHGLALSAWAFAGLSGNQLSSYIVSATDSFTNVLYVTTILYAVALVISFVLVKSSRTD